MSWKFKSPLGTLQCGTLAGRVDVTSPQHGIHQLQLESAPLAGSICCVTRNAATDSAAPSWPAQLADSYVRGTDLVATYNPSDDWPFAPQIYWRAEELDSVGDVFGSLSLLISVSTHLLDTHPRISSISKLPADEVLHVMPDSADTEQVREASAIRGRESVFRPGRGACCLLWRLPRGTLSYAEIVPASDFRQLTVTHDNDNIGRARWELFGEFLEKGVIRRARLFAVFLPRKNDTRLATACCLHFSSRPLPLTT